MRTLSFPALVVVLFAATATSSVGQAPDSLGFQGYLTDPAGLAIDTPGVDMTFKLYKGTAEIWSKTYVGVPVFSGIFNVNLGGNNLDTVAFDQPIDLGIKVGGDSEISPRTPLTGVAFARAMPAMYTFYRNVTAASDMSWNVVGGAPNNVIGSNVTGATISGGGGTEDAEPEPNRVLSSFGTIGGGYQNEVNGYAGTVSGGNANHAGTSGTIGGGSGNDATGQLATIGGGGANDAWGRYSMIPGGYNNKATAGYTFAAGTKAHAAHSGSFVWADSVYFLDPEFASTAENQFLVRAKGGVGIGTNAPNSQLTVSGDSDFDGSVVIGSSGTRGLLTLRGPEDRIMGPTLVFLGDAGNQSEAGRIRFMDGVSATNHRGAYIHYDGVGNALHIGVHDATDTLAVNDIDVITIERSGGDVGIKNTNPDYPLHVGTTTSDGNGAHVTNGGVWTAGSSRTFKEDLRLVDNEVILESVAKLPVYRWRYKNSEEGEHMGPVAEDFYEAFRLGDDDHYIGGVDGDGVALAAIQGLYELVKQQQAEIERMRAAMRKAGIE